MQFQNYLATFFITFFTFLFLARMNMFFKTQNYIFTSSLRFFPYLLFSHIFKLARLVLRISVTFFYVLRISGTFYGYPERFFPFYGYHERFTDIQNVFLRFTDIRNVLRISRTFLTFSRLSGTFYDPAYLHFRKFLKFRPRKGQQVVFCRSLPPRPRYKTDAKKDAKMTVFKWT